MRRRLPGHLASLAALLRSMTTAHGQGYQALIHRGGLSELMNQVASVQGYFRHGANGRPAFKPSPTGDPEDSVRRVGFRIVRMAPKVGNPKLANLVQRDRHEWHTCGHVAAAWRVFRSRREGA